MSASDASTTFGKRGATRGASGAMPGTAGVIGRLDVRAPHEPGVAPATANTTPPLRGEERWAVLAIAAATACLPLLKPGGPSNLAPVDALIAPALLFTLMWARTTRQVVRLPYLLPVALALVGGAIGAVIGPVPVRGGIALMQDLWLASWCWAVFNVSRTARNMRIVLSAWVYSAVVWGTVLIVGIITSASQLTGVTARNGARVQLTLGDPNYAANYFFISLMLVWAAQRPRRRSARYAVYAMFIVAIAFTGSNGGLVSLLVGIGIGAVAGIWRRGGVAPAVAALSLVLIVGGLVGTKLSLTSLQNQAQSSQYAFIRNGLGRGTSVSQRGQILSESIKLYYQGSIFGEGPQSTKPRLIKSHATFQKEAHDDYLAALIERGLIGFAGVLLLAAAVLMRGTGAVRDGMRNGYEAVVVRPNALLGAALGTLVAASFYGVLHNRHVWTLFAIVAAASFWGRGHE
jgi:O-antigen ligase